MLQQDIQSQCRALPKMKNASVFKGYSRARKITSPALLFENEEYVFGNKDSSGFNPAQQPVLFDLLWKIERKSNKHTADGKKQPGLKRKWRQTIVVSPFAYLTNHYSLAYSINNRDARSGLCLLSS